MKKTIEIEVEGETLVSVTKSIDLIQYMDDELSDNELEEYFEERLGKSSSREYDTTEAVLGILAGRADFLKELVFLVNARQAVNKDVLIAELNR